jgi:hypothetical protein
MKATEKIKGIKGFVRIEELNIETGEQKVFEADNMIMQAFYTLLFSFLNFDNLFLTGDEFTITHLALGTGTTAVTSSDTTLDTEIDRVAVTTKRIGVSSIESKFIVPPASAVGNIKEMGLFANATSTPDSGTLLSRLLINKQKTAVLQWTIIYTYQLA